MGFLGSDHDVAIIDAISEGVNDLNNLWYSALQFPIEVDRPAQLAKFMGDKLPGWLGYFEKLLHGKQYFVGGRLSLADLRVFVFLHKHRGNNPDFTEILAKYPYLVALHDRVSQRPRIQNYLASDPYKK